MRRAPILLLLTVTLAACGPTQPGADSGTEVTPPVPLSPVAGEIPEETTLITATIEDGALNPDRLTGQIGTAVELVVTGDGEEHTLAIEDLVADTPIAAEGDTTVAFTVGGDPGELDITLDGDPAGTFERQDAGGATT